MVKVHSGNAKSTTLESHCEHFVFPFTPVCVQGKMMEISQAELKAKFWCLYNLSRCRSFGVLGSLIAGFSLGLFL